MSQPQRGVKHILSKANRVSINDLAEPLRLRTIYWNNLKQTPFTLVGYPLVSLLLAPDKEHLNKRKRFLILLALYQNVAGKERDFFSLECEKFPPMIFKLEINKPIARALKILYSNADDELKEKPLEIKFFGFSAGRKSYELNILAGKEVPSLFGFLLEWQQTIGDVKGFMETLKAWKEEGKPLTQEDFDKLYSTVFINELEVYKECLKKKAEEAGEAEEMVEPEEEDVNPEDIDF